MKLQWQVISLGVNTSDQEVPLAKALKLHDAFRFMPKIEDASL